MFPLRGVRTSLGVASFQERVIDLLCLTEGGQLELFYSKSK